MVRGTFPWPQGAGGTVCGCKGDMRIIIHTYIKHFSSNVYIKMCYRYTYQSLWYFVPPSFLRGDVTSLMWPSMAVRLVGGAYNKLWYMVQCVL